MASSVQKRYFLGLKLLNSSVAEFNKPTPNRSGSQHRRLAVHFRDNALFSVFELAMAAMQQLKTSTNNHDLRKQVSLVPANPKPCLLGCPQEALFCTGQQCTPLGTQGLFTKALNPNINPCRQCRWRFNVCPLILWATASMTHLKISTRSRFDLLQMHHQSACLVKAGHLAWQINHGLTIHAMDTLVAATHMPRSCTLLKRVDFHDPAKFSAA